MRSSERFVTCEAEAGRGTWGIWYRCYDAPFVPLAPGLAGAAFLFAGLVRLVLLSWLLLGTICLISAGSILVSTARYLSIYTTRRGKFRGWAAMLDRLQLRGDSRSSMWTVART